MNAILPTITIDLVCCIYYNLYGDSHSQVLDRLAAKDVLHGVLHAILFHRLFGSIKPRTLEVLDVTMVSRYILQEIPYLSI